MHKQSVAALNFKFNSNLENEIKLRSALSSLQNCPLTISAWAAAAIGPHMSAFAKNDESSLVMTLFAARGKYSHFTKAKSSSNHNIIKVH